MYWSQALIPTERHAPTDSPSPGYAWLVRAGYIRQRASGVCDLLPLAARVVRKVEALIRRRLEVGAEEILAASAGMSAGDERPAATGLKDVAEMVGPILRNIPSARGVVLFRTSELFPPMERSRGGLFTLKAHHAFEVFAFAEKDYDTASYLSAIAAEVLTACGFPLVKAESADGTAFMLPADVGDERLLTSDTGNYAALSSAARTADRAWGWGGDPVGELERVFTPGAKSVEEVARLLDVRPRDVLKTLVFRTTATGRALESGVNPRWLIAVVRGDHEVSLAKLQAAAQMHFQIGLEPFNTSTEIAEHFAVGFVGPEAAINKVDAVLVVDFDAANHADWVAGANEADYHLQHFHWFRECGDRLADARKTVVADIRSALTGDPAPSGGTLIKRKAVTLAKIESPTPVDSELTCTTLTFVFERLLGALAEAFHDADGLTLPQAVAPFACIVCPLKYDGEAAILADRLTTELQAMGLDVLLDDRDLRPGAKFAEADLIGVPVRITIGERGLKEGSVELKRRGASAVMVKIESAAEGARSLLA